MEAPYEAQEVNAPSRFENFIFKIAFGIYISHPIRLEFSYGIIFYCRDILTASNRLLA
jgi:hypothetical protein